jgi:hypothetical protein
MFTKKAITLAALLIAGATTAAVAYEDPENKIGDRYPFLEQRYTPVATSNVAMKRMTVSQFDRHASEDPENKIGDRYPHLEQSYAATSTGNVSVARTAPQYIKLDQYANEAPENKIGDRYPFLEQPIQSASVGSNSTPASAARRVNSVRVSSAKLRDNNSARN